MIFNALRRPMPALLLTAACAVPPAAASGPTPPTDPQAIGEVRAGTGLLRGYLDPRQLPDSLALLPPPPAAGSAAEAADHEAHRGMQAHRQTPRWDLAARDAVLQFPQAASRFSCAMDLPITEAQTPHLYTLMRRTMADAGLASYRAKDHHQRQRPFVVFKEGTCSPGDEARLAKDGAYPSGHAALGWAWALVLSGLAPERTNALLQRGRAYGESRIVCGVHWRSDVEAGWLVGAAAVGRLQSDATFRAQAELARAEIAALRQQGQGSPRGDCAEEARWLAR